MPPGDLGRRKDLDLAILKLCCSGVTIRRSALLLGTSVNTVRRRMAAVAERTRAAHAEAAADPARLTSEVQFDEMVTFLNTKEQQLTIALAVSAVTGDILSARVGAIRTSGLLAGKGRERDWMANQGPAVRRAALLDAKRFLLPEEVSTFRCDGATSYPNLIRQIIGPDTVIESTRRINGDPHDPLFRLNHVCAKIRADLACMARDTWTTTKKIECLQDRLDIYIAWNNGYELEN